MNSSGFINKRIFHQLLWLIPALLFLVFFTESFEKSDFNLKNENTAGFSEQATYFYEIGKFYEYEGERDLARENLLKAVSMLPSEDSRALASYVLLARLTIHENSTEDDRKEMAKYISLLTDPKNSALEKAWGFALLSERHQLDGNRNEAIDAARKAVELAPNSPATQHMLGMALLKGKENGERVFHDEYLKEAIDAFERSLNLEKSMTHPYYFLGVAYWLDGERERAVKLWNEGLRVLHLDGYYPKSFKVRMRSQLENALANPGEIDSKRR